MAKKLSRPDVVKRLLAIVERETGSDYGAAVDAELAAIERKGHERGYVTACTHLRKSLAAQLREMLGAFSKRSDR